MASAITKSSSNISRSNCCACRVSSFLRPHTPRKYKLLVWVGGKEQEEKANEKKKMESIIKRKSRGVCASTATRRARAFVFVCRRNDTSRFKQRARTHPWDTHTKTHTHTTRARSHGEKATPLGCPIKQRHQIKTTATTTNQKTFFCFFFPPPLIHPSPASTQQERSFRPVTGKPGMGVARVTTEAVREREPGWTATRRDDDALLRLATTTGDVARIAEAADNTAIVTFFLWFFSVFRLFFFSCQKQ